jgi:hypothetical protein
VSDPNQAFTLRIFPFLRSHDPRAIVIRAFDDLGWDSAGRVKLTCEVRHGGRVIFPRGQLTCALHGTSDGIRAREMATYLVGMKPGDTDADYFADYTPEQLAWAEEYAEHVHIAGQNRYCDETGEPKRGAA